MRKLEGIYQKHATEETTRQQISTEKLASLKNQTSGAPYEFPALQYTPKIKLRAEDSLL